MVSTDLSCMSASRWAVIAAAAVGLVAMPAVADDGPQQWTIDGDRSSIEFVSDAPMERIVGTSEQLEGSVHFDADNVSETRGEIQFPVDSMRTGNSTRDRHLTEESWLHADDYPQITFEIEGLEDVETAHSEDRIDFRATATGSVEVRGVEQDSEADVEFAVLPERGVARIEPEFQLRLADHDVEGADNNIGNEVGEVIDINGLIYANAE